MQTEPEKENNLYSYQDEKYKYQIEEIYGNDKLKYILQKDLL